MSKSTVNYIASGCTPIIPQLVLSDAKKGLVFYQQAFGAELLHEMPNPKGGIMHAGMRISGMMFFVSDATPYAKPTAANNYLFVRDVDATLAAAVKAGAQVVAPLTDMFWGDRWCAVSDPSGNTWQLATRQEDVSPEEQQRRMAQLAR